MKRNRRKYSPLQLGSAAFMILALLWLTISIPFVYASQQAQEKLAKSTSHSPVSDNEEESSNPFSNTTEEKVPGTTSLSEEYLHDQHDSDCFISESTQYHKCEDADTYNAFHGELLVPPPNAA